MGACCVLLQLAPVSLCKQGLKFTYCYLTLCDWFSVCMPCRGVSNLWNGLWNGLMEWTDGMEYQLTKTYVYQYNL